VELIISTITIIGAVVGVGVFLMMHIDKRLDALQADIQRVDKKTDSSSSYRKIFHRTRFCRQGDYKLPCEPQ